MAVGLAAEIGETGVRGMGPGDLSDSVGLVVFCAAEILKESFGFMERTPPASIVTVLSTRRLKLKVSLKMKLKVVFKGESKPMTLCFFLVFAERLRSTKTSQVGMQGEETDY
jgi:hypothetical protein